MKQISTQFSHTSEKALDEKKLLRKVKNAVLKYKKNAEPKKLKVTVSNLKRKKLLVREHHKSPKSIKIKISDNTKSILKDVVQKDSRNKITAIISKPERPLLLLSPFRFPALQSKYMARLARYTGVTFVMLGGFFALLNLHVISDVQQDIFEDIQQNAETISSASTQTITATTNPPINTTPEPTITIESAQPFVGTIPVNITVPYAQTVKVLAKYENNSELILGSAVKIDDTTWRFYWDTKQFPDGEYSLKFVITNEYGTYQYSNPDLYVVENNISTSDLPKTSTVSTDSGTTATEIPSTTSLDTSSSSSTQTTDLHLVSLTLENSSSINGNSDIKVSVDNATEVKVFARNSTTNIVYFIAYGTNVQNSEWHINWNTTRVPNGTYYVQAKALVSDIFYESVAKKIYVENLVEENLATTTIQTPERPEIEMSFSDTSPLSGYVTIKLSTTDVFSIEMYALPKNSLTPYFLGTAQKISNNEWKFIWATRQSPNGRYEIYARTKSDYGYFESSKKGFDIFNEILTTFTQAQENEINTLQQANDSLEKETDGSDEYPENSNVPALAKTVYIQPVVSFVNELDYASTTKDAIERILSKFKAELISLLNNLAGAIRLNDEESIIQINEEIEKLKNNVLLELPSSVDSKEIVDKISLYLSKITFDLLELTKKNEAILKDRIGEAISKDSDKDSISDYDELNLYQTNPYTADTDGDGYNDGVEIEEGFDPRDSKNQTFVKHDSPKENGIVRADVLSILSISTLDDDSLLPEQAREPKAIISGLGLPNSFVTLYVYSTPVVATVKTDSLGNWSYIFEKELENGEHEIYVGITDNAGTIVAKSNSFPFVKTAEAYVSTGSTNSIVNTAVSEPNLFQFNSMLLVSSLAVVALGLVLILLGLHVHGKRNEDEGELLPA